MTNDLSLTVPFSPAIVLGPSIIKGDLIAIISLGTTRVFVIHTLIGGPSSNGSSSSNTNGELGSRPSGDSREGPHCHQLRLDASRWGIPEDLEAVRRPAYQLCRHIMRRYEAHLVG